MNTTYFDMLREITKDRLGYYKRWYYKGPMVITPKRDAELKRMQSVLYKACYYYVHHYKEYTNIISYEDKVMEILDYAEKYPFKAGTMRPDYIICKDGSLKFCEITSRFYAHAYYLNVFPATIAKEFEEAAGITDRVDRFEELLRLFAELPGDAKNMYVLKSADKTSEIAVYAPFYEALGLKVNIVEAKDVASVCDRLQGAFVVSALNQRDWLSLSMDNIKKIIDCGCRNDMRTIFLLHDKRFFKLFDCPEFTDRCLSKEETEFLKAHSIDTYLYNTDREVYEDALKNKNKYIIKPAKLGKSENVVAGCLVSSEEWNRVFENDLTDTVLQPFEDQKQFPTTWEGTPFMDYVCGAILSMDDKYYGSGLFRASSYPVINKTDDRKIAPVVTGQWDKFDSYHIL